MLQWYNFVYFTEEYIYFKGSYTANNFNLVLISNFKINGLIFIVEIILFRG